MEKADALTRCLAYAIEQRQRSRMSYGNAALLCDKTLKPGIVGLHHGSAIEENNVLPASPLLNSALSAVSMFGFPLQPHRAELSHREGYLHAGEEADDGRFHRNVVRVINKPIGQVGHPLPGYHTPAGDEILNNERRGFSGLHAKLTAQSIKHLQGGGNLKVTLVSHANGEQWSEAPPSLVGHVPSGRTQPRTGHCKGARLNYTREGVPTGLPQPLGLDKATHQLSATSTRPSSADKSQQDNWLKFASVADNCQSRPPMNRLNPCVREFAAVTMVQERFSTDCCVLANTSLLGDSNVVNSEIAHSFAAQGRERRPSSPGTAPFRDGLMSSIYGERHGGREACEDLTHRNEGFQLQQQGHARKHNTEVNGYGGADESYVGRYEGEWRAMTSVDSSPQHQTQAPHSSTLPTHSYCSSQFSNWHRSSNNYTIENNCSDSANLDDVRFLREANTTCSPVSNRYPGLHVEVTMDPSNNGNSVYPPEAFVSRKHMSTVDLYSSLNDTLLRCSHSLFERSVDIYIYMYTST